MTNVKYPDTKRDAVVDDVHGVKIPDPYRWLEDASKPEVKAWMAAEDRQARGFLAQLPGRDKLLARFKELYYLEAFTPPRRLGDRYFYMRRHKDKEKAVLYWKQGASGEERVLLDPNTLSADGSTSLGVWNPSWDGKTLVYGLKPNNSDETILHVMDVASGKISDVDVIPGGKYAGPSWTPKGDGFFYTWVPPLSDAVTPAERPGFAELRFHALGADPARDEVVHGRTGNPQTVLGGYSSKDGHWLIATIQHGWNASDVYFRDLRKHDDPWHPFVVGKPFQYGVDVHKDVFYVTTNEEAPRWRVFRVEARHVDRPSWREIVKERKDVVIESANVLGDRLMLRTMHNASSGLEVRDLHGQLAREVPLPGIGTVGAVVGDEDDDEAYFSFESFTTTPRSFKTSMHKGGLELFYKVEVPVDAAPYTVEQVWYPSKDGTRISMFVVRNKAMPKDGSTPFILTGYGGFQVSMTPSFYAGRFAWLEAGGGYAIPNLRGGGEYGEEWHKAGMREHKQNVFDDFAAAAEWLIANKYTRADKLAISGGSNGGLLMGAAITQHPELFRAVICAVPLLDMQRYSKLTAGPSWVAEYGDPDVPEDWAFLKEISAYQLVGPGKKYPPILLTTSARDDRVHPGHARKMAAKLQALGAMVYFHEPAEGGHAGAADNAHVAYNEALAYAFLRKTIAPEMA
ncbi:MAG TPA: prolyl oligopeptidase family serine peptidase [Polyangia bacterium]